MNGFEGYRSHLHPLPGLDWSFLRDPANGMLETRVTIVLAPPSGLDWSMLQDPGNGMLEAWVIMAIEIVLVLCAALYYEAVFGASEDSDGRRLHPFFLLGCKLGPDDPRGWAWFLPRKLAAIHWRLTHTHQLPQGGPPAAAVKPAATTSAAGSMAEASSTGATVRDHTPPNVPPSPAPSFASAVSRTVSDMEAGRRAAAAASVGVDTNISPAKRKRTKGGIQYIQ